MKRIQSLPRQRIWKWLVIGFWISYAIAICFLGVSLKSQTPEPRIGETIFVFNINMLGGIWSGLCFTLFFLFVLTAISCLSPSGPSITRKILGYGFAFFILLSLIIGNIIFHKWSVDKKIKPLPGPKGTTYRVLYINGLLYRDYECLAECRSHWYGETGRILSARRAPQRDYGPREVAVILPLEPEEQFPEFHEAFIYISPSNDWVLLLFWNGSDARCRLAYNIQAEKGYTSDLEDLKVQIQDLSPFLLIGPDTPIDFRYNHAVHIRYLMARDQAEHDAISKDLKHPNPQVRILATYMLTVSSFTKAPDQYHSPQYIEPDQQTKIKRILEIGSDSIINDLISLMEHPAPEVREEVVTALGFMQGRDAMDSLFSSLHDPNRSVRNIAAEALGKLVNSDDQNRLIELLNDSDPFVREKAVYLLEKIGNPQVIKPLLMSLHDSDVFVRQTTFSALGRLKSPESVPPLIAILNDWISSDRIMAAKTLGEIGDKRAVEPLIKNLHLGNPFLMRVGLRIQCINALGTIGDPRAIDPLTKLAQNKKGPGRNAAISALKKIREKNALPTTQTQ